MSVVARMKCNSVKLTGWATIIELNPVVGTAEDDPHYEEIKSFFAATPSGQLTMTVNNEVAAEQFQPGDEFYVSLEKIRSSSPATT